MKKFIFVLMLTFIAGNAFAHAPRLGCSAKKDANGNWVVLNSDVVSDTELDDFTFRLNNRAEYTNELGASAEMADNAGKNYRRFYFEAAEDKYRKPKKVGYELVLPVGFSTQAGKFRGVFRILMEDGSRATIKMGCNLY